MHKYISTNIQKFMGATNRQLCMWQHQASVLSIFNKISFSPHQLIRKRDQHNGRLKWQHPKSLTQWINALDHSLFGKLQLVVAVVLSLHVPPVKPVAQVEGHHGQGKEDGEEHVLLEESCRSWSWGETFDISFTSMPLNWKSKNFIPKVKKNSFLMILQLLNPLSASEKNPSL